MQLLLLLIQKGSYKYRSSFSEFFPDRMVECYSRYQTPPANFYLAQCFFSMVNTLTGNGGVLYYLASNIHMVVEDCVFASCSVNGRGGAVYFESSQGGSAFNRVCAYDCMTTTDKQGQFADITTSAGKKNWFQYTHIVRCDPLVASNGNQAPVYMTNGQQNISFFNASNNYATTNTGLSSQNPVSFNCKFATYANNRPASFTVVYISTGGASQMYMSNFVNNTSPNTNAIIQSANQNFAIEECAFYNNLNPLFGGFLTAYYCMISHAGAQTIGTDCAYISNLAFSSTFSLTNFGTALCITPTPDPTCTPMPTLEPQENSNCPTLPPIPTPPQSLPPSQTACIVISDNQAVSTLVQVFNLLRITLQMVYLI